MIYFGQDEFVAKWVQERIKVPCEFSTPRAVSIIKDDVLVAAAVFDHWSASRKEIFISFAADSKRAIDRTAICAVFGYPFIQLKCRRVTSYVPKNNRAARRLNEGIGFVMEGKLREYLSDGQDVFIYSWLAKEFFASKWYRHEKLAA